MKLFILMLLSTLPVLATQQAVFDDNGFARCFHTDYQTYFFDWDPFVQTSEKAVNYFELKDYRQATGHNLRSCQDYKLIRNVPSEILKDLSEIKNILPENVLFSLEQVAHGARIYRSEKTPAEYIANRKNIFKTDSPEVLTRLRHEVGDRFALQVMNYFTKEIAVRNRSCESLIGTCDFYLCQEQKNPCGLDGYNLSFGYKYCSGSKFKLLDKMTTSLGRRWVTDVFQCLQRHSLQDSFFLANGENTCSQIKKISYDAHPDCYVQAGFCHLKGSEKRHIFSLIKKEIISFQTLIQGFDIIQQCGGEN